MAHALPIALAVGGAAISGAGTIIGAHDKDKALRKEALQLERQAGIERAASQRKAMEEKRQARLVASRAQAVGAATGGALDPTVVNAMADIEGEGEFRALTALYEGEEEARGLEAQAVARRKEGKNAKKASYFQAAGSILSAGSTLADRYG